MRRMRQKRPDKQRLALPFVGFLWLVGIVVGSVFMFQHEFTPGESRPAPASLPAKFRAITPEEGQNLTLFMAVHPDCPCTGSSLEQLDRFLTRYPTEARAVALFWVPKGEQGSNTQTTDGSYWKRLNKLNTVSTVVDPQGRMAEKLGSLVSGAVVAYDQNGSLVFQGGLTATRGHDGPSVGFDSLVALANQEATPELCRTPSFGCSLNEES